MIRHAKNRSKINQKSMQKRGQKKWCQNEAKVTQKGTKMETEMDQKWPKGAEGDPTGDKKCKKKRKKACQKSCQNLMPEKDRFWTGFWFSRGPAEGGEACLASSAGRTLPSFIHNAWHRPVSADCSCGATADTFRYWPLKRTIWKQETSLYWLELAAKTFKISPTWLPKSM